MHFTHTLFTQYQITLRDAVLRDASFRLCVNRLSTYDAPGLSGINSSDVRGILFTLIELYVDENNVPRISFLKIICQDYHTYSANLLHTRVAKLRLMEFSMRPHYCS